MFRGVLSAVPMRAQPSALTDTPVTSVDIPDGIAYGFQFLVCSISSAREAILQICFVSWCMLVAHFYGEFNRLNNWIVNTRAFAS